MKLPYITNLLSKDINHIEPWLFKNNAPTFNTKLESSKWKASADTNHCFYSGFSGEFENQRTHKDTNPATTMLAIVADYDFKSDAAGWQALYDECPDDFKPYGMSNTMSGYLRIIWLLEKPIKCSDVTMWPKVLARIAKKRKLKKLFAGFDEKAFADQHRYYECGTNWRTFDGVPVTASHIESVIFEVAQKKNSETITDIPLEDIAKQVEVEYPGRWSSAFTEMSRGIRFWVPDADGASNAVIFKSGMYDFTAHSLIPWDQILSKEFIAKYKEQRYGRLLENIYWDGAWYYQFNGTRWNSYDKSNMTIDLKVAGLDARVEKGAVASQIDKFLSIVHSERRIDGALPMPFQPQFVTEGGKTYLNTSTKKLVPAGDGGLYWAHKFEWMAKFLDNFFDTPEQLPILLAWLQRLLFGAMENDPRLMQMLFLIGPPSSGKTLFVQRILGGIFGGVVDAEKFFLNESQFNGDLMESFIWYLDEVRHGMSDKERSAFSARIKRMAANELITNNRKFMKELSQKRRGSVVFSMNDDETSTEALPNIEAEVLDKLIFLKTGSIKPQPPEGTTINKTIDKELPHFVAYLINTFKPTEAEIDPTNRYGIKPFHHPDIIQTARDNSGHNMLQEVLEGYMISKLYGVGNEGKMWEGSTLMLYEEICGSDAYKRTMSKYNDRQFSNQIKQIRRVGGSRILNIEFNREVAANRRLQISLKPGTGPEAGVSSCVAKRVST